jgi:hypothetical protein
MELLQAPQYFAMNRERYKIYLRRQAGDPWPWTTDPILREYRFTNTFRELDKTTTWFRENIRDPLSHKATDDQGRLKLVDSTIIFRWFNRISSMQLVLDLLLYTWDSNEARKRLKDVKPLVSGAFMIKTVTGLNKLEGLLESLDLARLMTPDMVPRWGATLEGAWRDLQSVPFLGAFMAHEVIQDLYYTPILDQASDAMTWSSFGPGGTHGMSRIIGGHPKMFNRVSMTDQATMREAMIQLLEMSTKEEYWPQEWPKWNAHTVEFTCCEWDKYCRGQAGERLKRRYRQI